MEFFVLNLQRFSADVNPINVTTQASMQPTMKPFYDKTLLENSRAVQVFTQLGEEVSMHGNKIEKRKFDTFAKALTPLTEGVIPTGQNFGMSKMEFETNQYGDYTAISDRLELESYDNVIFGASEEMGAASGETYDTLTRNIISAGSAVAYADSSSGPVTSRANIDNTCLLTSTLVNKIYTYLKKNKAPRFANNTYVGVVHPSQVFDLRESQGWLEAHKYVDTTPILKGEIGMLHGIRFVESPEVKVVKNAAGKSVYLSLFMGLKAFIVLKPEGEDMEMILKDRKQAGGPLEQFSTIGYKFNHGAGIVYPDRIVRVETGSSLGDDDTAN